MHRISWAFAAHRRASAGCPAPGGVLAAFAVALLLAPAAAQTPPIATERPPAAAPREPGVPLTPPAAGTPVPQQQDPAAVTSPERRPVPPAELDPTTQAALERLATVLAERRQQLSSARLRLDHEQAATLEDEIRALGWQFASLAARVNVRQYESPSAGKVDLREQLEQLVRPLLTWLRDITAAPREITDQRERIEVLTKRRDTAAAALRAAERTRDLLPTDSAAHAEVQRELDQRWYPTLEALRDEILVLEANVARAETEQGTVFQNLTGALRDFVGSSGTTLLIALAVFLLVYVGLRRLSARLARRTRERSFGRRLLELVLRFGVLVLAVVAMMVVPYARADWLLFAVGVVFLIGAGWVVVRMLPQITEQLRLVLNVGGVREGERLIVDGLPFRVEALGFYTKLQNPDLDGGRLRVPVAFLVGRRSRPSGIDEPWFPSRSGDVVRLAGGMVATVKSQSPETVVLEYRGSPQSFPTLEYLDRCPRNLSRGFMAESRLIVARTELATVTTELLTQLERELAAAIEAVLPAGQFQRMQVMFEETTPIGFQLLALAHCDGAAAPRYLDLQRTLQRAFVDACRAHGWSLPAPAMVASSE